MERSFITYLPASIFKYFYNFFLYQALLLHKIEILLKFTYSYTKVLKKHVIYLM